jgi:hypothetical protein
MPTIYERDNNYANMPAIEPNNLSRLYTYNTNPTVALYCYPNQ